MKKLILIGFIFLCLLVGTWADSYDIEAVCTQVCDGIATFTDCEGHYWDWEIEKGESFSRNDVVTLTMHDRETQMREDDVILKIK